MESQASSLVIALVVVMASFFLLQTAGLLFALTRLTASMQRSQAAMVTLVQQLSSKLGQARSLLGRVEWTKERLPVLSDRANLTIDRVGYQIGRADDAAAAALVKAQGAVVEGGRRVEYALAQFKRHTSQLSKEVHLPAKHVSAVLKGVLVGLETFRSQGHQPPYPDDEEFI